MTNPKIAEYFSEIKSLKSVAIKNAATDYRQHMINDLIAPENCCGRNRMLPQIINTDSGFYVLMESRKGILANKLSTELLNIWEAQSIEANEVQNLFDGYRYGIPVTSLENNVEINDAPSIFDKKLVKKLLASNIDEIKPVHYEDVQVTKEDANKIQTNIESHEEELSDGLQFYDARGNVFELDDASPGQFP